MKLWEKGFNVDKAIENFTIGNDAELDLYLASGEWQDKAGAYGIQGLAAKFVKAINGSYSNVVGLPLFETSQLLEGVGFSQ